MTNAVDERIREDVCDQLGNGYLDASEVEVSVSNGEVTLSGTVPNRQTKYQLEELSDHVSGVKDVHNRLTIQRSMRTGDQSPTQSKSHVGQQDEQNGKRPTSSQPH